jgi:hypothetical protein
MNAIEEKYICKDVDGRLAMLLVTIEIPVPEDGEYSARVAIDDWNVGGRPIRGVTAMQALELAIGFAKNLLNGHVERGNLIYLARRDGSDPDENDLWSF